MTELNSENRRDHNEFATAEMSDVDKVCFAYLAYLYSLPLRCSYSVDFVFKKTGTDQ